MIAPLFLAWVLAAASEPTATVRAELLEHVALARDRRGTRDPEAHLPAPAEPDSAPRMVVRRRDWSTVVSVTIAVPFGTAHDPAGLEGAGWILANALAREGQAQLMGLSARFRAEAERGSTYFELTVQPRDWAPALARVARVLFEDELPDVSIDVAAADLEAQLRFEEGLPVRTFEQEFSDLLHGTGDPWTRPLKGWLDSVRRMTAGDVRSLHRRHVTKADTRIAVLGPMSETEAEDVVAGALGLRSDRPEPGPTGGTGLAGEDQTPVASGPPWTRGDRIVVTREVTNTWIGIGFPVPAEASRPELEFLAHAVREALSPTPPDPGVYSVRAGVEDGPGGTIFLLRAAVVPEVAARWEARMLAAVRDLASTSEPEAFFRLQRRRFRSAVVLEADRPEVEGRQLADDLARDGAPRYRASEIWGLTAESLRRAARSLGEPRVLVFGPDLSDRGSER